MGVVRLRIHRITPVSWPLGRPKPSLTGSILSWFDADTVVLNPYTPLELFLPSRSKHELGSICLVIGSNWDGLNSGVFGLRVDPWSVSLLSAVLAYPIYELKRQRQDKFRDQSAFQWLLVDVESSPLARNSPFFARDRWAEVPMRWFNALPFNNAFSKEGKWLISEPMTSSSFDQGTDDVYDDGHPPVVQPWKVMRGDMVVHFAGTSAASRQPGRDVRDSWIGPWTERAEAMLPEWANATTQEMLREETRMFWERIAEKWATARIQAREKFQPAAQRRQQKEV